MRIRQANHEQQHRGRSRQRRAHDERRRGTHGIVYDAEGDARDEHADAEHTVVEAERRALLVRRREIGDERLLRPFGQREMDAVDQEQRTKATAFVTSAKPR